MPNNDRWNLNRVGRASAATTVPGQVPSYGLAVDLGVNSTPYITAEQYQSLMRDVAARTATQALQSDPMYQQELQRAQNLQNVGYAMPNEEFMNTGEDPGFFDHVMTGVNMFKNAAGSMVGAASTDVDKAIRLAPIVGGYYQASGAEITEEADPTYERYKLLGGILTQDDFEDFDESTRAMLVQRAEARKTGENLLGLPGIKQAAFGIEKAYRALQTPFVMYGNNAGKAPFIGAIDPMWTQPGEWAEAWREAQNQSLGNAMVNSVLEPYVGQERIDEWKRESAIYQLTSLGVEVGAAWVADPAVIAGKTAGASIRLRRGEMPISEQGRQYKATTQALQREKITVGGLAGQMGKYRANRIQNRWTDLAEYAKTHSYADFAGLKMFRHRDIDGQPAAFALHWAFNKAPDSGVKLTDLVKSAEENRLGLNYPDFPSLTQQLLHGDPKAYADLNALKAAAPEEMEKFAPGAQSFIDAVEATKTAIPSLTREIEELSKVEPKSKFHEWSIHTEVEQRVKDITEAEDVLRKYEGYGAWFDNVNRAPRVEQVSAKRGFFMDNQFGRTHEFQKWTRPLWIKKANTVEMHDADSGAESIRRQFEQFDHLFGYRQPEALDDALIRWHSAGTNAERYDVVRDIEETHLIQAAAERFNVHPGVIRTIFEKMEAEQNKLFNGIRRGDKSMYNTAPEGTARLAGGDSNINLVSRDPDNNLVTLELMQSGGRRVTVTVHESAIQPRGQRPIDPTQTPNYYQPLDTRRFYLELKRNRDLIETMELAGIRPENLPGAGIVRTTRKGKAVAAEFTDAIGTRFNALWKPAVLFRFGWPMRVLMDENMRALAVLGIPAFTKYYGSDYARAMNNATIRTAEAGRNAYNAMIHDPIVAKRTGRKTMNIGPGPVSQSMKRTMDPIARDEAVLNAPRIPESFTPVLNNSRYEAVSKAVGDWDDYERAFNKHRAWERESDKMGEGERSVLDNLEGGSPTLQRAVDQGFTFEPPAMPDHPMRRLMADLPKPTNVVAYNPLSLKQDRSGYLVPLNHTRISARGSSTREIIAWYKQNRELLGSTGYRIMQTPDGDLFVARAFQSRFEDKARAMAEFTESGGYYGLRNGSFMGVQHRPAPDVYAEAAGMNEAFDAAQAANYELRRQELGVEDPMIDFDFDLDSDLSPTRHIVKKRRGGYGTVTVKAADGTKVEYPSAYEGHRGEMMRSLVSSQGAMEVLSDGHGAATSLMRRQAVGHRAYQPPVMTDAARTKGTAEYKVAIEYFHRWRDLLNSQIANSPIWSKMLNGWSDEKIVRWLNNSPDGAQVRRELKHDYQDTDLWVNEHRAKLDYYLPNKKLQRLLGNGQLEWSQIRREIHEDDYPTVFGPDVEFLSKIEGPGHLLGWMADRIWHGLGTLPIDTLSRHPFARAMYDLKMRSLIGTTDAKWLDEATIGRYETQARKYARDQVRKTLWDLMDQTNFTDALRFVSPFWGAQFEAMVKWGKIVSDRPETVARAFMLNNAVYQNFHTIDEEGNPISRGRFDYTPTDRVILRIPSVMRKMPWGQGLETIGTIGIPVGSANTVLQGEKPLLPGPGPMLTIPADLFMKYTSEIYGTQYDENDLYRWLFPIGRPKGGLVARTLDQVSPGWARRVQDLAEGDGGIAYNNLMTTVAREMTIENQRKGLPAPTPAEVEKQAKWLWSVRILAGLVSPVQTEFRPKHQFVLDAAHKYQQNYGLDWFDRFVEDYGIEMSRYAVSSSNSTVGVPPTSQGMEEWKSNRDLIQQYQAWGDAIISPDAHSDDFSSDAYYTQFELNLGPGDDTPLRESQSMSERFAIADARAGWYEFRQVDAMLDVQLQERGLHSLQQVGAEDLAEMKRNFIADLTQRNASWREEYNSFNNDIYSRVNELQEWAFRPEFDNRPDIQGARQYLMIRDQVTAELDRYAATTGGSRSLQAQENGALREWFYSQVGQLAQANPSFAEFYSRYLSQDTLEQGSGGF